MKTQLAGVAEVVDPVVYRYVMEVQLAMAGLPQNVIYTMTDEEVFKYAAVVEALIERSEGKH